MKKWSYVAVALMIAGSGMALTSCIDNDEPFGIEQIRLATANLLEAKKAAVEAEAAAKSAQVEIAKINAEIEKLRIENEKILTEANAKIAEAEAKKIEAEAEAALLRAQGEKAVSDAEAAKLLAEADAKAHEADYWQAQADAIRMDAQGRYEEKQQAIAEAQQKAEDEHKDAERKLAEAIYAFEKEKAYNADSWNTALWTQVEAAFQKYLKTIKAYNDANESYLTALNEMAALEADLVWVEKDGTIPGEEGFKAPESGFYSPNYKKKDTLLKLIAEQKATIEDYENTVALLNDYKAQLEQLKGTYNAEKQQFEEGDWYKILSEKEEALTAAEDALQQAKLEKDLLKVDNADVYEKPEELKAQQAAVYSEQVEIAPFSIDPMPEVLSVLSQQWAKPITVVNQGVWFSIEYPYAITSSQSRFNNIIRDLRLAKLDGNDVLWTEASKAEMNRELENGSFVETKAHWENARDVYNTGDTPKVDLLPKADDVKNAIKDYNDLASEGQKLQDAYKSALKDFETAYQAWSDATDAYNNETGAVAAYDKARRDYRDALDAAQDAYDKATQLADKELGTARANIELKKANLWHTYAADQIAYERILLDDKATVADKTKAEKKAKESQEAYDAYVDYSEDKDGNQNNGEYLDLQAGQKAYDKAVETALVDLHQAQYNATDVMLAAQKKFNDAGGWDAYKDPAYDAVKQADADLQAAQDAKDAAQTAKEEFMETVKPIYDTMVAAIAEQVSEMGVGTDSWKIQTWPEEGDITDYIAETSDFVKASIPAEYLGADGVYQNAKWYLTSTSQTAFGMLGEKYDINDFQTYDLISDQAILIKDATNENLLDLVDNYCRKMILAANPGLSDEDGITQFQISQLYQFFNQFGHVADLTVKVAYADIVLKNKDNSEIDQWITKLTDARDTMLASFTQQLEKYDEVSAKYQEAEQDAKALTAQADANIKHAQALYDLYYAIIEEPTVEEIDGISISVPSLREWVESLADNALGATEDQMNVLNGYISSTQGKLEDKEADLANAKDLLEKYEYQLGQYESEDYSKVVNPYKYTVENLEAEVARLAEKMEFWKNRYEELLKQYNDAKKNANYPD